MKTFLRKDVRKMERHEKAFAYGILFVVFFAFFMTTSLVKAYAIDYSFTPKEYKRLLQDTCLMGVRLVDDKGEYHRGFEKYGPIIRDKDGKLIGQTKAWFTINEAGDRAQLVIMSHIIGKNGTILTQILLVDNDLDGKPDLQSSLERTLGEDYELGEVTRDGKEFWNVWIVRFIERDR
jgi:hypothetical protein